MTPLARARAPALALLVAGVASCGACGACGKGGGAPPDGEASSPSSSSAPASGASREPVDAQAARAASPLWRHAKDGDEEDLAALAVDEGAAGLAEAAADPALRATALRAMGLSRGWAATPYLAKTAAAGPDDEARIALASLADLAARPRRAEDPEDADELRVACEALAALAKDAARPKERRAGAVRALRMMPCPKADLPTDFDVK